MQPSRENPFLPTIIESDDLTSGRSSTGFLAWWRSDWGPGPLLTLALPLIMSTGFMSIMLFEDRTLLYYWDKDSAPAAMGAGSMYWSLMTLPNGMLGYLSAFVAQ